MPDVLTPALDALLVCASDAFADELPNRRILAPGAEVAWDDCCDGQLWVQLASLVPANTSQDTRRAAGGGPCGVLMWVATVKVGILRCAATVDDNGNFPSAATLTAEAHQMLTDLETLRGAITCCMAGQVPLLRMVNWLPLGPAGGCVGGEWTCTLNIDNCPCP